MVRRASGLAIAFALVACSGSAPTTSQASPIPYSTPLSIAWKACGGALQCGTVTVPLDYSNPSGETIKIAVIRKPGIDYLRRATVLLANLNKRMDLVGFDPRGVGLSAPVRCLSGSQLDAIGAIDPVVDDPQERLALIQANKDYARACQQRAGKILPFVDTVSAAKDMDVVRAALGDAKLT